MKKNGLKRLISLNLLVLALCLSGCSETASSDVEEDKTTKESQAENLAEGAQTSNFADVKDEKEEEETREKADIEALAAECVFNVNWYTQDGDYSAGTSFLMDSDVHGEKLLVSAFHFLWPENADTFTGSEVPDYVLGGEIYNACTYEFTGASLKENVIIEDADSVPNVTKDVSAFTIQGGDDLKTLPLATASVEEGEKIYLLANLWDTEDIHENCVYEGQVISTGGGELYYSLDGKPGTNGASGAPIVNEYGEVIAIHMGSNPLYYVAHTTDSFLEQINQGTISEVVYPDYAVYDENEVDEEIEYTEYLEFARDEKVSSMFYDVQLEAVNVSDTLAGETCQEGYQYVVIDISLWAASDMTEPVPMFYYDFAIEWEEEYCYPLEQGWTEAQLPDEYTITQEQTTGQLVFMAPVDSEEVIFSFVDTYYTDDPDEASYGAYYEMNIPLENWTR